MENTTQVLCIVLIALAGIGIAFYLLCRTMNVGPSEQKAMKTSKKSDHGTEAPRD